VAGVFWWNRPIVRALFRGADGPPVFCSDYVSAIRAARDANGHVVAWASRLCDTHIALCRNEGVDLIRIEDGFIRSIGLGAGFVAAASLAVDAQGIYYDARRPSDLETALQHATLSDADRSVGAALRARLVAARLSKYNLRHRPVRIARPHGRPVVLVVGQVADDASIKLCHSATIDCEGRENINLQLLRSVRARHPSAFIVFKPHPDVVAQLRSGAITSEVTRKYADTVVSDANVIDLIDIADVVETISSLAGFEALLRRKTVVVHGSPFYAGWGLTQDLTPLPRRTATRSIDELAFIAFTKYTRHMNPLTGATCDAAELIDALQMLRASRRHRLRIGTLKWAAWACENIKVMERKA